MNSFNKKLTAGALALGVAVPFAAVAGGIFKSEDVVVNVPKDKAFCTKIIPGNYNVNSTDTGLLIAMLSSTFDNEGKTTWISTDPDKLPPPDDGGIIVPISADDYQSPANVDTVAGTCSIKQSAGFFKTETHVYKIK